MYLPPQFAEPHVQEVHCIIHEHPLGMLVRNTGAGLEADHLPFLLDTDQGADGQDSQGMLIAHVARANAMWQEIKNGEDVLVVFRGADGYISPNWYPSKHEHHQLVPTWNYRVVHAHGTVRLHDDKKWVLGAIGKLTRTHEQRTHEVLPHAAGPWKIKDAPPAYLDSMLAHIVGIEIAVERIEAKFKLSQNRSATDLHSAVTQVSAAGNPALGAAMDQR